MADDRTHAFTTGEFGQDGGATYRTWYVTEAQHRALCESLGEPDVERYQTAAELEASNALVDSFETPPLHGDTP